MVRSFRYFLPQNKRETVFYFLVLGLVTSVALWELICVLPFNHSTVNAVSVFHFCAGLFIVLNIFANFFYMIRTKTTVRDYAKKWHNRTEWPVCPKCDIHCPPRSHHCKYCDTCVLKRDHHCVFSGACIGYYNHRHFILGLTYLWIGATYATYYHWSYLVSRVYGLTEQHFIYLLAPHVAYALGYITMDLFILFCCCVLCIVASFVPLLVLVFQFRGIFRGQTPYESKQKIKRYNIRLKENLEEVFGNSFYSSFIFPWFASRLPGDGFVFRERYP